MEWQRCSTLAWRRVRDGGTLAGAVPGSIMVRGEDLAGWGRTQQIGRDKLSPAQQWAREHVLGIEPLPAEQKPAGKVSHTEKEQRNLRAAAQFRERKGHLDAPRQHKEPLVLGDGTTAEISLGLFIANTRSRRAHIPTTRAQRLTRLGIRRQ